MDKRPITFFPIPLTDEMLYSIVARYHLLSGNRSTDKTLIQLFNTRTMVTITGLPPRISVLTQQLPIGWIDSGLELINRFTLFPYYRAFLSQNQVSEAMYRMLGLSGAGIKIGMGLPASRLGAVDIPRYCPECAANDFVRHGTPYWHRCHLLSGNLVCYHHEIELFHTTFAPHQPSRHALFLPPYKEYQRQDPHFSSLQMQLLLKIAKNGSALLQRGFAPISGVDILSVYKKRLDEMGMVSENGSVRQKEVQKVLRSFYTEISNISPFDSLFNASESDGWMSSLLRKHRKSVHPLKHLLMITALFESLDEFINCLQSKDHKEVETLAKKIEVCGLDVHCLEQLLEKEKVSLTKAASILGVSVVTVSVAAVKHRFQILRKRPKQHSPKIVRLAFRLLMKGEDLSEIGQKLNMSISHMNRMLRINPQLRYLRGQSLFRRERRNRRLLLEEILKNEAEVRLSQARQKNPGNWTWLYRHDRDWLYAKFSRENKRKNGDATRINWHLRDTEAASAVKICAENLMNNLGKPRRLTKTTIARAAGVQSIVETHIDSLPETQKCLKMVAETVEDFQKRRIAYIADKLLSEGCKLLPWRIKKLAGLPKVLTKRLQRELYEQARYISTGTLSQDLTK